MEIQVDSKYQGIAALIRYATILLTHKSSKNLSVYGEKVVSLANSLNFYALPFSIINNNSSTEVYKAIKNHFKEGNQEKNVLSLNQADQHIIDSIGVSEIEKNKKQILDCFQHFYEKGNFEKLLRGCYRFLKKIKDVNEYDMNDAVLRYLIAAICLRDFSNFDNIVDTISQEYVLFDYNIYQFFLYLVAGKYNEASKKLLQIKNNISDDFFEYVKEEDLAFYFSFCLLYNFNIADYKEVLSNNDIYVYKLYDKYPKFFNIVDAYYKCDYLNVNNEFNKKLKDKINKDPFLCGNSDDIEKKFKEKILKEIMSFSSEISFKTIADLLVIEKNKASSMIESLIRNNQINAIIDDINEIVIMKQPNEMNELLNKSNATMKNNLDDLIKFSYNNIKHKIGGKIEGKGITRKRMDPREMNMMMDFMMDSG